MSMNEMPLTLALDVGRCGLGVSPHFPARPLVAPLQFAVFASLPGRAWIIESSKEFDLVAT